MDTRTISVTACFDKLYEICKDNTNDTLFIMNVSEEEITAQISTSKEVFEKVRDNGKIHISLISETRTTEMISYVVNLIKETDGKIIRARTEAIKSYVGEYLSDSYSIITANNYELVKLDNRLERDSGTDTDDDELSDWSEVDIEAIYELGGDSVNGKSYLEMYDMPTIEQCIEKYIEKYPFLQSIVDRFSNDRIKKIISFIRITPIISDPTNMDSDGDYLYDFIDSRALLSDIVGYKSLCLNFSIGKTGSSNHSFVAPSSGYYRFEMYHENKDILKLFVNSNADNQLKAYIGDTLDMRAYCFLNKGDVAFLTIDGNINSKYNLYITKATAYLCGVKYPDSLDTTIDVSIQKDFFEAYGFDTVVYNSNNFNGIYEYYTDDYPFSHTNDEFVIINSHGYRGHVVNSSLGEIFIPSTGNCFSQNIITFFMCCEGYFSVDDCNASGARIALGFNDSIDDASTMYFSCSALYSLLYEHISFLKICNIYVPYLNSGINSDAIKISYDDIEEIYLIDEWLSNIIYIGSENTNAIDYTDWQEISNYCLQLKPFPVT